MSIVLAIRQEQTIMPKKHWIARLLGRDVQLKPRQSPTEIPGARAFWDLSELNKDLPNVAQFHERVVLRERNGVELTAEIYVPHGQGPFPSLLYVHGGSWCLWSAAHVRKMAMEIASRGFVVVNLNYGLAPEYPFPWAVEDTVFAVRWMTTHISGYSGRPAGLFLGGDSAGANLVAAAHIALCTHQLISNDSKVADPASVQLAGLLLIYGIFDFPLLFSKPGKNAGAGTIETTWNLAYLGPNFVSVHRDPLVSPAYWSEPHRFPPCYVNCGAEDALLPQTFRMAEVLTDAGVPTTVSVVAEEDHGFLMLTAVDEAAAAELERMCQWMKLEAAKGEQI